MRKVDLFDTSNNAVARIYPKDQHADLPRLLEWAGRIFMFSRETENGARYDEATVRKAVTLEDVW